MICFRFIWLPSLASLKHTHNVQRSSLFRVLFRPNAGTRGFLDGQIENVKTEINGIAFALYMLKCIIYDDVDCIHSFPCFLFLIIAIVVCTHTQQCWIIAGDCWFTSASGFLRGGECEGEKGRSKPIKHIRWVFEMVLCDLWLEKESTTSYNCPSPSSLMIYICPMHVRSECDSRNGMQFMKSIKIGNLWLRSIAIFKCKNIFILIVAGTMQQQTATINNYDDDSSNFRIFAIFLLPSPPPFPSYSFLRFDGLLSFDIMCCK